jgi:hypothetical protein
MGVSSLLSPLAFRLSPAPRLSPFARNLLHFSCRSSLYGTGEADFMKKWEYKIINVRSENYSMDPRRAEELNRLGDEGWELVSITSINFKTGATDHIGMVFKREKASA